MIFFKETKFNYELKVGELSQGQTLPFALKSSLVSESDTLQLIGKILNFSSNPRFEGGVKVKGKNLAKFLPNKGSSNFFDILSHPYSFEGSVNTFNKEVEIQALKLSVGKSHFYGDFTANFSKSLIFSANLTTKHLDISDWSNNSTHSPTTQISTLKNKTTKQNKLRQKDSFKAFPYAFVLGNARGSLILSADTISYRNGIIRDLGLNTNIEKEALILNHLSFQFPGGSDFSGQGRFSKLKTTPIFIGKINLNSEDFRGVLGWLGIEVNKIPNNRLRKLSVASKIRLNNRQANFSDLTMTLDSSRINGAATVALSKRPSFGISAFIDRINFDSYLSSTEKNNILS